MVWEMQRIRELLFLKNIYMYIHQYIHCECISIKKSVKRFRQLSTIHYQGSSILQIICYIKFQKYKVWFTAGDHRTCTPLFHCIPLPFLWADLIRLRHPVDSVQQSLSPYLLVCPLLGILASLLLSQHGRGEQRLASFHWNIKSQCRKMCSCNSLLLYLQTTLTDLKHNQFTGKTKHHNLFANWLLSSDFITEWNYFQCKWVNLNPYTKIYIFICIPSVTDSNAPTT